MGNYKFRLSDMIPNAWFYKLKDMNRVRNQQKHHPTKEKHTPSSSSTLSSSSQSSLSLSSSIAAQNHSSKSSNQPHLSDQRKSYYFTRDLTTFSPDKTRTLETEPPRKSSRRRRSTRRIRNSNRVSPRARLVSSTVSAGCSCRTTLESVWTKLPDSTPEEYPDSPLDHSSSSEHDSMLPEYGSERGLTPDKFDDGMVSWSTTTSCQCTMENDIDIYKPKPFDDNVSQMERLPPIITKKTSEPTKIRTTSAEFSEKNAYGSLSVKVVKEDFLPDATVWKSTDQPMMMKTATSPIMRRSSAHSSSPGVKLRMNSPRIGYRRIQGRKSVSSSSSSGSRRSVSESFAVVKSSKDPWRDFRESMVEMIVENNIRASKDLEELLACYLSLNSDEYHDLIINVFKQIWFDFIHLRLK